MPTTLVVTGNMDNANIVTIARVSLLTSAPPAPGISVGTRGSSGDVILSYISVVPVNTGNQAKKWVMLIPSGKN